MSVEMTTALTAENTPADTESAPNVDENAIDIDAEVTVDESESNEQV